MRRFRLASTWLLLIFTSTGLAPHANADEPKPGSLLQFQCIYTQFGAATANCEDLTPTAGSAALEYPISMTLSSDGESGYVAVDKTNWPIRAFSIDPQTGLVSLSNARCVDVSDNPCTTESDSDLYTLSVLALSHSGDRLYAATAFNGTLPVFEVADDGSLSQLSDGCVAGADRHSCSFDDGLLGVSSIAIEGRYLYATSFYATDSGYFVTAYSIGDDGRLTQLEGGGCVAGSGSSQHVCSYGDGVNWATAITFSPDGRYAYVGSAAEPGEEPTNLTVYRVSEGGDLVQLEQGCVAGDDDHLCGSSEQDGLSGLNYLTASPDGRFLYATALYSATITVYEVKSDGRLRQLPEGCVAGDDDHLCGESDGLAMPTRIVLAPDGTYAYAGASSGLTAYSVDGDSGVLRQIEDGCRAGEDQHSCGADDGVLSPSGIAFDPLGRLYVSAAGSDALSAYTVAGGPPIPESEPDPEPSPEVTTPDPAPSSQSEEQRQAVGTDTPSVVLPSNRRCVSRRNFRIRIRQRHGYRIISARVLVDGKLARTIRDSRLRSTVNLRGLPKGRFRVSIDARTSDGRRLTGERRYRTCTKKIKSRRPPRL